MVYNHITPTTMEQGEFQYHVYFNRDEAAIEVYKNEQIISRAFDFNNFVSSTLLGSFTSLNGFITEGLRFAEKKAERTGLPIIVMFEYQNEPEEIIAKRKKNKTWNTIERIVIYLLLAAIAWKSILLTLDIN